MIEKKKMLYLMHIDWNWIKQRPQYIEEALESYYDITILCPRNYRLQEYHDKNNIKVFYTIPFIHRYPFLWGIDAYRKKVKIRRLVRNINPEIIYCTSPEYASMIPSSYSGHVIYDCMDDMLAFNTRAHHVARVTKQEKLMVERADIVLATSERLKRILSIRYPDAGNIFYLVRNGYDGNVAESVAHKRHDIFTLCYFGTISHWFNFEYLNRSLRDIPNLKYKLIGPIESGTIIPQNERIIHVPPVSHDELLNQTIDVDAFIMPFELNELILSVDPVKLYEYINFGKNILCVEYPEIKRFESFVFFYKEYDTFIAQIKSMMQTESPKYSENKRLEFLRCNSWEQRADAIVKRIIEIDEH